MTQRLFVRITPDGRIEAKTHGMEGATCIPYMELLENWLEAEIVESARVSFAQNLTQETTVLDASRVSLNSNIS